MDAFVVRTPRHYLATKATPSSRSRPGCRKGQQRRLNDLKGVVVLEEIEAASNKLTDSTLSSEEKIEILNKLAAKKPSTEIIISTGIGKVVQKLSKADGQEVAKAAQAVTKTWKALLERRVELSLSQDKPQVKTDLETRTIRDKAVKLLVKAYPSVTLTILESLEKRLFQHYRPLIGLKFRRSVRRIVTSPGKFTPHLENSDFDFVLKTVLS
jgi:hypothetical protein